LKRAALAIDIRNSKGKPRLQLICVQIYVSLFLSLLWSEKKLHVANPKVVSSLFAWLKVLFSDLL